MCGILGCFPALPEEEFVPVLDLLGHRGPDDSGVWSDGVCTLGHRRLSILDTSPLGHQPMLSRDGRRVLVFNGEIYNFVELRRELETRGHGFVSGSDSEVLLSAYEEWGQDCLLHMNGMWAFAIWDKEARSLFIARDRFGKKPFFYTLSPGRFAFASEMKAVCPFLRDLTPSPYFPWMAENVHDYESTGECLVDGIRRLSAGCCAVYRNGELSVRRYWNSLEHLPDVPLRYDDQVERFRELFVDACRIRMRSDVPIGTALSGGLDSSAVFCALAHIARNGGGERVSDDWQHAVSATFPGTSFDESQYAQAVVDRVGTDATMLVIDPMQHLSRLDEYFYLFEDLYITSPIPMMCTYEEMRNRGIVVSIDGHGADELLAGYAESLFTAYPDCRSLRDVDGVISAFQGLFDDSASYSLRSRNFYRCDYLKRFRLRPAGMRTRAHALGFARWAIGDRLTDGILSKVKPARAAGRGTGDAVPADAPGLIDFEQNDRFMSLDHFGRHLYILFHHTTMPTLLRNYDRYSMASGVEIRMPFMDHRLATYCLALPWRSKIRNGYTKSILRDAVRDLIPKKVVERRSKIGFGSPAIEWLQRDMREFIFDTIRSTGFLACPVIANPRALACQIEQVANAERPLYRAAENAWRQFMIYLWYRGFFERVIQGPRVAP